MNNLKLIPLHVHLAISIGLPDRFFCIAFADVDRMEGRPLGAHECFSNHSIVAVAGCSNTSAALSVHLVLVMLSNSIVVNASLSIVPFVAACRSVRLVVDHELWWGLVHKSQLTTGIRGLIPVVTPRLTGHNAR
eukprot:COSAG02_NODE_1258_length_13569_cov_5.275650_5_plen_134_part_00